MITAVAWLSACATPASMVEAAGAHDRRFQTNASCGEVADHIIPSLLDLGFRIEIGPLREACPMEIVARRPASALSWGELVRVRLYEAEHRSMLAIGTERVLATNLTARPDWADEIYQQIVGRMSHGSP